MTLTTPHPYTIACGIDYIRENYLKWQAIQLAIYLVVGLQITTEL